MRNGAAFKVDPNGHKVRLGEEADVLLMVRAAHEGMSTGEYLRELVMVHLYGVDGLAKLHLERLSRLARHGPGDGPALTLPRPASRRPAASVNRGG